MSELQALNLVEEIECYYRAVEAGKNMTNQAKFCDVPDGYIPANRRIYNNLKKPFRWLWEGISWLGMPFLQALPFAMVASLAVTVSLRIREGMDVLTGAAVYDVLTVGLVWAGLLGALFLAVRLLRALLK